MKHFVKPFVSCTAVVCYFFTLLCIPITAQSFSGSGSGTSLDPFLITTPEELDEVRDFLDNNNVCFKLGNDIDLTAYLAPGGAGEAKWGISGWEPIGIGPATTTLNTFRGFFDGAGYKITGLWINRPAGECIGFFGQTVNATIVNLGIELAPAGITGGLRVGGLAGRVTAYYGGNTDVKNCYVIGDVKGDLGSVGGLIGELSIMAFTATYAYCTGTVENCWSAGTVSEVTPGSNKGNIGGLIGYRYTGGISTLNNCYSTCDVTGGSYTGGLVGGMHIGNGTLNVSPLPTSFAVCATTNCYATGNVNSPSAGNVGGLIGWFQRYDDGSSVNVSSCFTTGNVAGSLTNTGGIVGVISNYSGTGTILLMDNFRYTYATVNGSITPTTGYGPGLRDGDGDATAIDFMSQTTYSTDTYLTTVWPFGAGGAWTWDNDEKYPMLGFTPETYPFPFYAIDYELNGGTMPSAGVKNSYDPHIPDIPYTLPTTPVRTGYVFSGWVDGSGAPVADIPAGSTGHKKFFAVWGVAPTITGPTSMTLTEGYAATATGAYTTAGTPAPTVTKTSGNAAITWNVATQQLDIATGLAVGTYPVVLTASNGMSPDATITFTLTVVPGFFVTYHANGGIGTQTDPNNPYTGGQVVTVLDTGTIVYDRHVFTHWNTMPDGTGISYNPGDDFTITADVVLYAQWKETPYISPTIQRLITIAPAINGRVASDRTFAASRETVMLTIVPDAGYQLESITVSHTNYETITIPVKDYGDVCTFQMPPHVVTVRATFKPATRTDVATCQVASLQAYVRNGVLTASGLTARQPWSVYHLNGTLIYHAAPDHANRGEVALPGRGIYIVVSGNETVKVIY